MDFRSPYLKISLLGKPAIISGGEPGGDRLSKKAIALLAYLVTGPDKSFHRDELAALFWGEMGDEKANFNFRRVLWSLRREINPPDFPHDCYIRYENELYSFEQASDYWLDVALFDEALHSIGLKMRGIDEGRPARLRPAQVAQLQSALELYQNDFMAGFRLPNCPQFEEWMFMERDRFKLQYLSGLRLLAAYQVESLGLHQALETYQKIAAADPTDEAAHSEIMQLYAATGNRQAALMQYQRLSQILRLKLELEPLPQTQALFEQIRTGAFTPPWSGGPAALDTGRFLEQPAFPFVGREQEQTFLMEASQAVEAGNGTVLAVAGPAGVGKTRLAEEFLAHQAKSGFLILQSACYLKEGSLPYQPLIDALRSQITSFGPGYLALLKEVWLAEISKLLPELPAYLPKAPVSPPLLPEQERGRLFEGMAQFLSHLARRSPLIIFLDDLHYADEPTLELLHYLGRRLSRTPVLILVNLREPEIEEDRHLNDLLRSLKRAGCLKSLLLEKLAEPEASQLVWEALPHDLASEALAHRLYEESGGNPFFLIEMVQAIQEENDSVGQDLPIPNSIKEVIKGRLGRLEQWSRRCLNAASVIGRKFDSSTLQELFPQDEDPLLEALAYLRERKWIVQVSGGEDGLYDFGHGLVRDVVYQLLTGDQRRSLHLRIAGVLEARSQAQGELAAMIAHHYWEAGAYFPAHHYMLAAANYSSKLFAYREAKNYILHAIDAARLAGRPLPPEELRVVMLQLGRAQQLLGEYESAIQTYRAALNEHVISGKAGQEIFHDPVYRQLSFQLALTHDRKGEYRQALDLLQLLESHIPDSDRVEDILDRARIAWGTARVHLHREQNHQAMALCGAALALLSRLEWSQEVGAIQISCYHTIARSNFDLGNYQTSVEHYHHSMDIARRLDQQAIIPRLLTGLGHVARRWGNYDQAETYARESMEFSQKIGLVAGIAASHGVLGNVAYNRGRLDEAYIHYQQALEIYRQLGEQHGIADYNISQAFVLFDQGQVAAAERLLNEAYQIGRTIHSDLVLIRAVYHLAKIARAQGDLNKARRRASMAIKKAESAGIELMKALSLRLLGEIQAKEREPIQAEENILKSLKILEKLGERFEVAWTLRSYALALEQRGEISRARSLLKQSASIFTELGAERERFKTEEKLSSLD